MTQVTLCGNIARDPELRYTPDGKAVVNFDLPVTARRRNPAGEWEDGDTSWYRVAVWHQQATNAADTLHKGDRVMVVGTLKMRGFERTDGSKGTSAEVTASEVAVSLRWATAAVVRNGNGSRAA